VISFYYKTLEIFSLADGVKTNRPACKKQTGLFGDVL